MAKKRVQRKRSRQVGSGGGGKGGAAFSVEVAKIVGQEESKLKREGKWKPVGSPLLHGLLGRSRVSVAALAAKEWAKATGGAGVVLVDGKPVEPGEGQVG